jgi:hypothetical protein
VLHRVFELKEETAIFISDDDNDKVKGKDKVAPVLN